MRKLLTALTVMAAVTLPLSAFATTQVEVTTNVGNFTIQLDEQKAQSVVRTSYVMLKTAVTKVLFSTV